MSVLTGEQSRLCFSVVINSRLSFTLMTHLSWGKRKGCVFREGMMIQERGGNVALCFRLIKHLAFHLVKKSSDDSLTCFLSTCCALVFLALFQSAII